MVSGDVTITGSYCLLCLFKYGYDVSVNDFTKGMNKGIVVPHGQNGIKRLIANTKIGGKVFEFEVKVFGESANYRLYGNFDKSNGNYVGDNFGKALH